HDVHDHHEHGDDIHDHAMSDVHDQNVRSVAVTSHAAMDAAKVEAWLTELTQTRGPDILRAKGIIDVAGEERRLVFQAVHMLLEGDFQRPWKADEPRYSRLVFIGRHLDGAALQESFAKCAAGPASTAAREALATGDA